MKLNIGAGLERIDGFLSVDANPDTHPDILADADRLISIETASVDEIRAVDVLEHMPYRRTDATLREWARVLKTGGKLYVQVPDFYTVVRWINEGGKRLLERLPDDLPKTVMAGVNWRLMGGQDDTYGADGWRYNSHYTLFTSDSLSEALHEAGFKITDISTNPHPNICCFAVKR